MDAPAASHGNGVAGGGGLADLKLPAEDELRFRGVHQEIPHFGAPPKRTESLYMKAAEPQQPTYKVCIFIVSYSNEFLRQMSGRSGWVRCVQ